MISHFSSLQVREVLSLVRSSPQGLFVGGLGGDDLMTSLSKWQLIGSCRVDSTDHNPKR